MESQAFAELEKKLSVSGSNNASKKKARKLGSVKPYVPYTVRYHVDFSSMLLQISLRESQPLKNAAEWAVTTASGLLTGKN